jgi:hypothetical protein
MPINQKFLRLIVFYLSISQTCVTIKKMLYGRLAVLTFKKTKGSAGSIDLEREFEGGVLK